MTPCQPPRAAYIHVPFCAHRCWYCDFAVVAGKDFLAEKYLDALEKEISTLGSPQPVETIFIGGGTPTQLSPDQLRRLLEIVRRWLLGWPAREFSVEANPGTLSDEKISILA